MQAPIVVNNTYFFCAHSNGRFNDYIKDKIKPFKNQNSSINWIQDLSTLHCTLGSIYGKNIPPTSIPLLNQKLTQRTVTALNNIPHSLLTRIEGFDITKNGWVILKFTPNQKLNDVHQTVVDEMVNQGLTPSKFSGNNFMAHVSIGSIKPGADINVAKQEVQQLFKTIIQDRFPFIVYDLELNYTTSGANHSLFHQHLERQKIGIQEVKNLGNRYVVKMDNFEHADTLARRLLKYYDIQSTQNPGQQKTVKPIGNHFAIYLTPQDYAKVNGVFHNLMA